MQLIVGFLVAMTIGLTGVGGGVLTVPILILFLNVPMADAVGTALAFSAVVKVPACFVYLRRRRVDFRVLRLMLLGGVPGVIAGSLLLSGLENAGMKDFVLGAVGATIALTAALNLARMLAGNDSVRPSVDRARLLPPLTLGIGLEVGFSSAGAGALGTLALLSLTQLGPAEVIGTDLVFGLTLSAVGGALHLGLGQWSPRLLLLLIAGGLPGALIGARLATVLPARLLRGVLLVWLIYLGSTLLWRAVAGA
jgi:uncharacterized protein